MIVLTGGAGFIGSCFLWKLNQEGIKDILVVDHLDNSKKWKNLVGKNFYDYIEKTDFFNVRNKQTSSKTPSHCISWCMQLDNFFKCQSLYKKTIMNILSFFSSGLLNLEFLLSTLRPLQRMETKNTTMTRRHIISLNMYSFSKHMFDLWLLNNNYFNKATGIKFFNVFGPNEYHKGDLRANLSI